MKTNIKNRSTVTLTAADQPIGYVVSDAPIPYRVRVGTASPALREFVVPVLGIKGSAVPPETGSEAGLRFVA